MAADPRDPAQDDPAPTPLLVLAAALALGGAIGAVSQFLLVKGLWIWDMPDLAHRFLAAAAAAYAAGGVLVLARRGRADAELLAATVLFYGYPLVAVILIDADIVDWGRPIAWAFIVVVTPAVLVGTLHLLRAGREPAHAPGAGPAPALTRALLLFLGGAGAVLGVLVFAAPQDVGALWPWGELSAWRTADHRLVASMLLTIAGAAALALRRNDPRATRLFLAMVIAYCAVAVAGLALHAADTPGFGDRDAVYIAALTAVGAIAAAALARRPRAA